MAPYVSGAATIYAEGKGQALFAGDTAYELKCLDSLTGERLSPSVDKQVERMDIRNTDPWDNINATLTVWRKRGIKRLQSSDQIIQDAITRRDLGTESRALSPLNSSLCSLGGARRPTRISPGVAEVERTSAAGRLVQGWLISTKPSTRRSSLNPPLLSSEVGTNRAWHVPEKFTTAEIHHERTKVTRRPDHERRQG